MSRAVCALFALVSYVLVAPTEASAAPPGAGTVAPGSEVVSQGRTIFGTGAGGTGKTFESNGDEYPPGANGDVVSAHVLVGTKLTPDWSGYALAGRAISGVTGTFNVPVQLKSGSCLDETAVWVGVDGLDNRDLLQAGIVERGFDLPTSSGSPDGPTPGIRCLDRAQVYGFWEDLPSAPVRVDLPVRMGDVVSVSIFKMSPGWWVLAMHDITAGRSFLLSQPYAGPDTSLEWVVEAPMVMGLFTDPVPTSTVRFRDLGAQGDPRELERVRCCSGGLASGPGLVAGANQLMQAGFAVNWAAQR
jgi:Peptidase A4 family